MDKEDKGFISYDNVSLLLLNLNDYMIHEITSFNPLDTSFEKKAMEKEEYILEKLFTNSQIITSDDYFENYKKNSAFEALILNITETQIYILKKYELNITKNHIYNRINTIKISIKENESLIESILNESKF